MKAYEEILEAMEAEYRSRTGFSPDSASDVGIRLKVLAGQLAELYQAAAELERQVFPQTSTGDYLELHAATRGISRKAAQAARGILRFSRETASAQDIPIEKGALCATREEEAVHFETEESVRLPAGELWVEAPARAVEPGGGGNAAPGAVCLMVSAPPGIAAVHNPAPFEGGVDAEGDEELRRRLLRSFANISNSTNRAFYYDLAMGDEAVASASILPRRRGRGTVDVVAACHSPAGEAAAVERLQAELDRQKEINVDVRVLPAVRDGIDVTARIAVKEGHAFSGVAAACREALTGLLEGMEAGKPLLLAALGSALYRVEGVENYRILTPAADVETAEDHVVRCGMVEIERMSA